MNTLATWRGLNSFTGEYGYTCVNSVTDETWERAVNQRFGGWTRRQLAIINEIIEILHEMHVEDLHPRHVACIECGCYVIGKELLFP